MICTTCTAGATANTVGDTTVSAILHGQCKGCECQHKTGEGWFKQA